jgi:glycosyltransferase involved in cell wall biosynthesis
VPPEVRVLYSFPHALGAPGIATSAWHQVAGVLEEGVEVSLYVTSVARPLPGSARTTTTLAIGNRRIPHRALGVDRAYRYHDARVARALRRVAGEIDVVHCWPGACLQTMAAARELGIPALREAPSAHTAEAFEQAAREQELVGVELPVGHAFRFDADRLAQEEQEFAAAAGLLVPSSYAASTYLRRGIAPERVLRHQYGFDPERFRVGARRDAGEPFTALFVGRGEPTKGLHYALDAWHRSGVGATGRFVIVGEMLPAYAERLAPMLDDPSIEVREFAPAVETIMQAADVLVLPSVTEGSALVTYEAQGAGCALLVSDASGAPLSDDVEGLIHPARDVDALTEHFRRTATDPELRHRLRAGVLAHRDELTWRRAGAGLRAVYEQAAGSLRPPPA